MQSFSELGVPARIVRKLAERDIHTPFPIQERVLREALAGRDVLAKAPTGSGQDARRLRYRSSSDSTLGDRQSRRARSRTDARARVPGCRRSGVARAEGRRGRDGLWRRSDPYPGEARAARPRPGRDSRSPERPPRAQGDLARRCHDPGARRGRQNARHGLQASGRPHRAAASAHSADDVLLGDSRRDGRRAR